MMHVFTNRETDTITTEVIRYELVSAAQEMKRLFKRTTTLGVLYELNDFGISIFDSDVNLIADVPGIPIFSGTLNECVRSCVRQVGLENLAPGDVLITTIPFDIGGQPVDAAMVAPVFFAGEVVAYTALKAHMGDFGAIDPYPTRSTDMYQEGLMLPAMWFCRQGQLQDQIVRLIKANSRIPNTTATSCIAGASALRAGARRVELVLERYGTATFRAAIKELITHGEKIARSAVDAIPSGTWEVVDWMDNNGVEDEPVKISVKVTVGLGQFIVDLSGSAPQQRGPINSPYPGTVSACRYAFKAITSPLLPANEGHFRPLKVIAPPGNMYHPLPPAACFLYGWSELRLIDLIPMALTTVIPDRVPAHSAGDLLPILMTYFDMKTGRGDYGGGVDGIGMGASHDRDGESALIHHAEAGCCNIPIEVQEWRVPLLTERYELRPDSGGPGKFRGGVGTAKIFRTLAPSTTITIIERTTATRVTGVEGGKPGALNACVFYPGTPREYRRGKNIIELQPGEAVESLGGGGCGWGDPFARDPQLVLEDIVSGYVTRQGAEVDYGVIVREAAGEFILDLAATNLLRSSRK